MYCLRSYRTIRWRAVDALMCANPTARIPQVYGHDVTEWAGFELLRDIREFRMTTMTVQAASANPAWREQALHRLACIRGEPGPRPWSGWRALEQLDSIASTTNRSDRPLLRHVTGE